MDEILPLSKGAIDALKILFVALALVAVVLRLVANWKYNRRLLVDDCESCINDTGLSYTLDANPFILSLDISISAIPFLISVAVLSDEAGNGN